MRILSRPPSRSGRALAVAVIVVATTAAATAPAAALPSVVSVAPSTGLHDLDTVTLTLSGLVVGTQYFPTQCTTAGPGGQGAALSECDPRIGSSLVAAATNATVDLQVRSSMQVIGSGAIVDCVVSGPPTCAAAVVEFGSLAVAKMPIAFAVPVGAVLSGAVRDADGAPVVGAVVAASGRSDTTDGSGRYALDLTEGTHFVSVSPPDASLSGTTASVTVTGATVHDFVLAATATLRGVVSGPGGVPVADALVTIDCSAPTCESTTGADGVFEIAGLDAGEYWIAVRPPAGSFLTPWPSSPDGEGRYVVVDPGETATVDLALVEGGRLVVVAVGAAGEALPLGEAVVCEVVDGACTWLDLDDDFGALRSAAGLEPGEYLLAVRVLGGLPPRGGIEVTISAGVETHVEAVFDTATVSGTVTDQQGAPVADVDIELRCTTGCGVDTMRTGPDGSYLLAGQPGAYVLRFEPHGPVPVYPADRAVELVPGATTLDVVLDPAAAIEIVAAHGEPVAGVICASGGAVCWNLFTQVGDDAVGLGGIEPGRYDVIVSAGFGGITSDDTVADVDAPPGVVTVVDVAVQVDGDGDSVGDEREGDGDVNGDATLDRLQPEVVSIAHDAGGRFAIGRRRAGTIAMFATRDPAAVSPAPDGVAFDTGIVGLRASTSGFGSYDLWFPGTADALYGERGSGGWVRLDGLGVNGAELDANHAHVRVFDGGPIDLDGSINGAIVVNFAPVNDGVGAATIVEGPTGFTTSSPTFGFEAPVESALFCSLDWEEFAPCASPVSYTDLAPGPHVFVVRPLVEGIAGAGDYRVFVVADPLPIRITAGPVGVTHDRSATFEIAAPGAAGVRCILDLAIVDDCDAGITYSALTLGPHLLLAVAVDALGEPVGVDLRYWSAVGAAGAAT